MSDNLMIHFDDTNLDSHISGGITLVDFYADWCGPCKTLSPIIEKIATTYKDVVRVGKMDVEESPESSKKYMIISIPTVIFFKDGKEVSRFVGVKSFKDISSIIDGIINS